MSIKKISLSLLFVLLAFCKVNAQQYANPEYIKATNERAAKIVVKLELNDAKKDQAVTEIIGQQYRDLSKIQDARDAEIKKVKEDATLPKEKQETAIIKLKADADNSIAELHKSYLKKLATQLNEDKITAVKDGMTYNVMPNTYAAFQDMLPNLTKAQKKYIYDNLVEAREHAMDGGSADEKHAWFGKYKGKINNQLSKEGYDLKKESADWKIRVEEREKNKKKD